jgi:hypothetical protein
LKRFEQRDLARAEIVNLREIDAESNDRIFHRYGDDIHEAGWNTKIVD